MGLLEFNDLLRGVAFLRKELEKDFFRAPNILLELLRPKDRPSLDLASVTSGIAKIRIKNRASFLIYSSTYLYIKDLLYRETIRSSTLKTKKARISDTGFLYKKMVPLPSLTPSHPGTTFGAGGLNC